MYADTDYYSNNFYEARQECKIPDENKAMYLRKATAFLNSLFVNSKPQEPYCEELKNACCEIADCLYESELTENISSENNDGYSVSYNNTFSDTNKKAYVIAQRHLALTGLLYGGI